MMAILPRSECLNSNFKRELIVSITPKLGRRDPRRHFELARTEFKSKFKMLVQWFVIYQSFGEYYPFTELFIHRICPFHWVLCDALLYDFWSFRKQSHAVMA